MGKLYGIVGGIYSRRIREELEELDSNVHISRMWTEVDDLLRELATSRSFVEEIDTILILDTALENLGVDNKREKKLLTLQNELALGKSSIHLKVLTTNSILYTQLRNKMLNVHNRLYEHFEIYNPNTALTPLIVMNVLKGNVEGIKPPTNKKAISKVDWNLEISTKIENVERSLDVIADDMSDLRTEQESSFKYLKETLDDIKEQLNALTNTIK